MARLNEIPVSMDSLETLRKKMLRQNRELAKSNNIRALRIRELENECACMLSENLELRGRILELERQVEDNEARRIADHALAIKAKLESQLTEWGTLLAGLGLEPPMKKHSPHIRKSLKQRMSFSSTRPSPSQRRLRDIARDIEELGHISETKSYGRKSMNPEQIMALRSEADTSVESPELGPPPMSQFIDEDPVKVDSPSNAARERHREQSPESPGKGRLEPPIAFSSSPSSGRENTAAEFSPEKRVEAVIWPIQPTDNNPEEPVTQPIKAGSKRKLAARDDFDGIQIQRLHSENDVHKLVAGKDSSRRKNGSKLSVLKDASVNQDIAEFLENPRKPLAAKSTNDDISSPKKNAKPKGLSADDVAIAKANLVPARLQDRKKPKSKGPRSAKIQPVSLHEIEPSKSSELAIPVLEPALLALNSPEPTSAVEGSRGDTPPPTDISSQGETSRPSRRNRAAISYAEPNLRDKMRRPTKELFDAVAGEGKYSRRASQSETAASEAVLLKRDSNIEDGPGEAQDIAYTTPGKHLSLSRPDSPTEEAILCPENLPSSVVTERRKRVSSAITKTVDGDDDMGMDGNTGSKDSSVSLDSSELADVYEFNSPQSEREESRDAKKPHRRQTTSSRRASAAVDAEDGSSARDRNASRRRSMMV